MSTIALVPMRAGSERIPGKNTKTIAGKPLCYWMLDALLQSNLVDGVWVSTESEEIITIVRELFPQDVYWHSRPQYLSSDDATTEEVMLEFMRHREADTLVTAQVTSPLTTSKDIDSALRVYHNLRYDSMLSVVRKRQFVWREYRDIVTPMNYDPYYRPLSQDWDGSLFENGAFYITNTKQLERTKSRLCGRVGAYVMPSYTGIELDEPEDWFIVEQLLYKYKGDQCNG